MKEFTSGKKLLNVNIVASVLVIGEFLRGTKKFTIEKSCINVTAAKVHLNACFVIVREQEVI